MISGAIKLRVASSVSPAVWAPIWFAGTLLPWLAWVSGCVASGFPADGGLADNSSVASACVAVGADVAPTAGANSIPFPVVVSSSGVAWV